MSIYVEFGDMENEPVRSRENVVKSWTRLVYIAIHVILFTENIILSISVQTILLQMSPHTFSGNMCIVI